MLNVFEDMEYIGKLFSVWGVRKKKIDLEAPTRWGEKPRHLAVSISKDDWEKMDKIKGMTGCSHSGQVRVAVRLLIESFDEHGFI